MRKLLAAAATVALGLALGAGSRAQDHKDKADSKHGHAGPRTIRGVVAAVTTEGEMVVDYQAKKAVEVEAAFLTVVGDREAAPDAKDGGRAPVYMVWLTPKTKVCSSRDESGKPADKTECAAAKIEVGDRVEARCIRREETTAAPGSNPTASMKLKHGRHRVQSVEAHEITILPATRDAHHGGGAEKAKSDS